MYKVHYRNQHNKQIQIHDTHPMKNNMQNRDLHNYFDGYLYLCNKPLTTLLILTICMFNY